MSREKPETDSELVERMRREIGLSPSGWRFYDGLSREEFAMLDACGYLPIATGTYDEVQTIVEQRKADEHPAPWRWERGAIGSSGTFPQGVLRDARGGYILGRGGGDSSGCPPPDLGPKTAALIAAAPEMEALLRELFPYFDPLPEDIDPGLGLLLTKMLMLIKRIDAAKGSE